MLLDRTGRIWAGTEQGLAVLQPGPDGPQPRRVLPRAGADLERTTVLALLEDDEGSIWAGTHERGLYRIATDLTDVRNFPGAIPGLFFIRDLVTGPDGRIWCAFLGGLSRLHAKPETRSNPVAEIFDHRSGVPSVLSRASRQRDVGPLLT